MIYYTSKSVQNWDITSNLLVVICILLNFYFKYVTGDITCHMTNLLGPNWLICSFIETSSKLKWNDVPWLLKTNHGCVITSVRQSGRSYLSEHWPFIDKKFISGRSYATPCFISIQFVWHSNRNHKQVWHIVCAMDTY